MSRADVTELQRRLTAAGYPCDADGVLGPKTRAAAGAWHAADRAARRGMGVGAAGADAGDILEALRRAAKTEPEVPAVPAYVTGLDVSGHNADVDDAGDDDADMAKIKAAGHSFVVIKASQGEHYRYKSMPRLRDAAERVGLSVAFYHYATPSAEPGDAEREAANFVRAVGGVQSPCILAAKCWLDNEDPKTVFARDPAALEAWSARFSTACDDAFGLLTGFYTGPWYWEHPKRWLGRTTAFVHRPLWLASYPRNVPTPDAVPPALGGWKPAIWQYSRKATVPGLRGGFDVNRSYTPAGPGRA